MTKVWVVLGTNLESDFPVLIYGVYSTEGLAAARVLDLEADYDADDISFSYQDHVLDVNEE